MSGLFSSNLLADGWLATYWGWLIAALIVVGGLGIFGLSDTLRFSIKRTWAISNVCFAESIRKRVLWIAPVAMVGVIIVAQFERAIDEQDAIRQTVKFCLFTTAIVVLLSSIILACTNLPKEIESRVIFTIVTKPTTRLELIVGKIVGFSRVSLAILLIMGVFTWCYVEIRAWDRTNEIKNRLAEGNVSETERARLTHFVDAGILTSRTYWVADELQIFGEAPAPSSSSGMIAGEGDESVLVPFQIDRNVFFGPEPASQNAQDWARQGVGTVGLFIRAKVGWKWDGKPPADAFETSNQLGPATQPIIHPPRVTIDVLDINHFNIVPGLNMFGATSLDELMPLIVDSLRNNKPAKNAIGANVRISDGGDTGYVYTWVPPALAMGLFRHGVFFVGITGSNEEAQYFIGDDPISVFIPAIQNGQLIVDDPKIARQILPLNGYDGKPMPKIFRGRRGLHGDQQLKGSTQEPVPTALFTFVNAPRADTDNGEIPFQISVDTNRSLSDIEEGNEDATTLQIMLRDHSSGKTTTRTIPIESRQPAFFSVPADAITGPDFDLLVQCHNEYQTVSLYPESLQLVTAKESFSANLAKSLLILWMMSILVITLSIACSTFLSWPIAVVLTTILLVGRWEVTQLADQTTPALGPQFVTDFGLKDQAVSSVVSEGVNFMSKTLNYFAQILPDTAKFDAIEDIEENVSMPGQKLADAFAVMVGFGLPGMVAAYLILKRKEVAP